MFPKHIRNKALLLLVLALSSTLVNGQSFSERAIASFNNGNQKEGIRWMDWAIKADTANAELYLIRARMLLAAGNTDRSFSDFDKSVDLNPTADSYFYFAEAYKQIGDFNKAISKYSKAIDLQPVSIAECLMGRAMSYSRLRKYDKAINDYTEVIKLEDANYLNAYFQRGQAKLYNKQKKAALADFDTVIKLNPKNIQLTWDMGGIAYELEEFALAISYYTKAMEQVDPNPSLYLVRGETFEKLKHYEAAVADYSEAIELNPNLAEAHYSRGQAKARWGKNKEACVDWKKASELGHVDAKNVVVYNCK